MPATDVGWNLPKVGRHQGVGGITSTKLVSVSNKPTQATIEIGLAITQSNGFMMASLFVPKRPNHWSRGTVVGAEA